MAIINGTGGDDLNLTGTASADTINGFAGHDNLKGLAGNDNLNGGDGHDFLDGGAGNDSLDGGAGDDLLKGDTGNDILVGGSGIDSAYYLGAAAGVVVNLALTTPQNTGGAGTDTLSEIEHLTGSSFGDTLTGDANANLLDGGSGNDALIGGAGNDSLFGGSDSDALIAGAGDDFLAGGFGNDTLEGGDGNDTLEGGGGNDGLDGGAGNDVLRGSLGNDVLKGGSGIDTASYAGTGFAGVTVSLALTTPQNTVLGGIDTLSGIENLIGSSLNDTLRGNTGANVLNGGFGNDTLLSGLGNDTLVGGPGKDTMAGSGNGDRFDFNALAESVVGANRDLIQDFNRVQGDKIDLSTIDADIDSTAGNQAFSFIGAGTFTGVDGQLRCAAGIIQGDVNGDKVADFEIKVNLATMIGSDFIL